MFYNNKIFDRSPYLNYLYAFLILFVFGLGIGFLRNNLKKPLQFKETIVNSSTNNGNKNPIDKDLINDESKKSSEK